MTDKTKTLLNTQYNPNFRYSQSSLNSTETSENDYNLYCFSQGYKNHEKGYWRGVLRNKNIDFDLRFNKEWNRRIELEGDSFEKSDSLLQNSTQFSNEFIKFVNDNEIGWDFGRFENFKKKQVQTGGKKQKNKEWLLSNGVKRNAGAVELRTQNYKQFEENEKNKELKKAYLSTQTKLQEVKTGYQVGKQYEYSAKKGTAEKLQKSLKSSSDNYNTFKTITASTNINEQKGTYSSIGNNKRIESSFTEDKSFKGLPRRNLETEYNAGQYQRSILDKNISSIGKGAKDKNYDIYKSQGAKSKYQTQSDKKSYTKIMIDQGYKKSSPKPSDLKTNYGTGYTSGKKNLQEFKYSQKGTYSDQKSNIYVKKSSDADRPANLGRLEVSVEKKKKERVERKPGSRTHERLCSSKKRKLSYDKDGKPLKNTARLNVSTEKKKEKRERLDNIGRLEISAERKKKERIERKPGSRKHDRIHSSKKKRKISYDKDGKPLTNTARLNVSTEKKKPKRERLDNLSKLDISVEKKKERVERKPGSRKHDRIHSSKKKRKISYDKDGKPLTNTARLNVSTEKKKEKRERLDNHSQLEVSVEGKKKQRLERKPGSRKHDRVVSSKKKRKISYDKEGKPLTNTARLNVSTEKKKPKRERLDNFSKLEVSIDKDKRATLKRTGSNFERTESAKLGPKKAFDTTVRRQLKTEKKITTKYDITRQKTEPYTFKKTDYNKEQPKQTLQTVSTYTRTKQQQQTPQQTHLMSYIRKQPQAQSQQQIHTSSYNRTKQQQSSYIGSKPKDYPQKSIYEKKQQQATYGQAKTYNDYSKYNKYQSYTDQKLKGSAKIEEKYKQQQKPSYVKKFDFTDKSEKTKEMGRHQTAYNLQKITKKTQIGKPGEYSIQEKKINDRPSNLGRLEISVEKKKKERVERKPGSRTHERLCSSKKRKLSYDKDGKLLKNTARLNVSTEKKKEKRERLDNIGRLEISAERKKKERIERKPGSRKHDRIHSSKKKRKISYDKDGKPLTNTARLNVSTEKKKPKRERLDNLSKLEISVEKKKERVERKPGSRKHDRIHSSKKKRKISYDKDGKPLTNTARLNVSTEKKKEKRERLDNHSQLEVSVEGKKKQRLERKPGSRKHDRVVSSKKKRKISYDKDGKPLTNTARLNVSTEKKKEKRERLDNHSQLEVSVEGKKKERLERKPGSRKHDRVVSSKKKRKISYDSEGKPLTNTSRLKIGFENNKLKYMEKDEYNKNKNMERFNTFEKRKTEYAFKKYPTAKKEYGQKQGTQVTSSYSYYAQNQTPKDKSSLKAQPYQYNTYQKPQKPQDQRISTIQQSRQTTGTGKKQTIETTPSYIYPSSAQKQLSTQRAIKKYPTSNYLSQSQTSTSYQRSGIKPDYQQYTISSRTQQQGTYKDNNATYTVSSSQVNTAATNTRSRYGRMKSVEGSDNKFLFKDQKQYGGKTSSLQQDTKRYALPGQKALSVPKKYSPQKRRTQTGYQEPATPQRTIGLYQPKGQKSTIQKGGKLADTVKIDLSKYLPNQPSTAQKSKHVEKANVPEIYEYYPLSKTAQKNKLVQIANQNKSNATGTSVQFQSKTAKKEHYKAPKISEADIYEYNPIKSNLYEYKPAINQIKKDGQQRRGLAQSTEAGYKKSSTNRQTYQNIVDKNRPISINLDKYTSGRTQSDRYNTLQNKSVKTPSYSYQKDRIITYGNNAKGSQSLNNRYQLSDENKRDSTQRTKSERKGSMAFFKLQFLTTKQVCEKFWKQIDSGELSNSMFDIQIRSSGTASKLSNFLSPEKNRQSKFSISNENTEYSAKNSKLGRLSYKVGNKGMSNSTSESYLKNIRDVRQSYKSGF